MGAALGCCGGPSADYDAPFRKSSSAARYHPLLGRCDTVEKSLLQKVQRSISSSWPARLAEPLRSPHAMSSSSRYGLDDHYESESDSDDELPSNTRGSITSATSGSRLLCDFYNLVLECDHSKFFFDAAGRRVKGAYLAEIEIFEDYFDLSRRTTVGTRRRRRSSIEALPYQPPQKLKHLGSNSFYDRSSNMSLMSNDTSDTMASESDYWATFMDAPSEPVDFLTEMTFPPKYGSHNTPRRSRRDSLARTRSWIIHEQLFGGEGSSFPLFSPVNASTSLQRTSSRGAMRAAFDKQTSLPTESTRYNLWTTNTTEEADPKATILPAAFSSAAVSERRRASLTVGASASSNSTGNRRMSLHTVAPIAV